MRIRSRLAILVCIALSLKLTALAETTVVATGSSTVAPLVSELAQSFEKKHEDLRIEVEMGGSSRGVADARNKKSDLGLVSRALKPDEAKELQSVTIALDGIALIVNSANQIKELTASQIVDIYTGKVTNWKEVGGSDIPIVVVNKAQGRSTLELFLEHFKLKPEQIKASAVIGDNPQGLKLVAGNIAAIAYVSIGAAEFEANRGQPVRMLPLEGVPATRSNVQNGTYSLKRPLNVVYLPPLSGPAREFVDFATSTLADPIVESLYFVPIAR